MSSHSDADQELIGRSYTRSRRMPNMFGRMPGRDGAYLPGGPYTATQAIIWCVLMLAAWKIPVFDWAFGPLRWVVPFAVAYFVRRARIEARTPAGWLAGLFTHLTAPRNGTYRGRSWRAPEPAWVRPRIHVHHPLVDELVEELDVERVDAAAPAPQPAVEQVPAPGTSPAADDVVEPIELAAAAAASDSTEHAETASPLQQLLARTRHETDKAA